MSTLANPIELNATSASFWVNSSTYLVGLVSSEMHMHIDPPRHYGLGFKSTILSFGFAGLIKPS
jgi:hypothetical protein